MTSHFIVTLDDETPFEHVCADLENAGAHVTQRLPLLRTVLVDAPSIAFTRLRHVPGVDTFSYDTAVTIPRPEEPLQ